MDQDQLQELKQALSGAISSSIETGFKDLKLPGSSNDPGGGSNTNTPTNLSRSLSALSGGAKVFSTMLQQINRNSMTMSEFGANINDTSGIVGSLAGIIPGIGPKLQGVAELFGGAVNVATAFIEDNVNVFRDLSKVGGGLNGNLFELQTNSARAGLGLRDFAQISIDNAENFVMLGGSVNEGTKRFTELSNRMRQGKVVDQLMNLGMTLTESNEFLAKNTQLNIRQANAMRRAGATEQEVQDAQLDQIRSLAKNYSVIARLTGKQVSQIQDEMIARNREGATIAALRLLEKDNITGAQESYNAAQEGLKGAPSVLNDLVRDLIQTGAPLTEATQNFMAVNGEAGELAMQIANAVKSGASAEEVESLAEKATAKTLEFANSRQGLTIATFSQISDVAQGQATVLEEVNGILTGLSSNIKSSGDITKDYLELIKKLEEATQKQVQLTQEANPGAGMLAATNELEQSFADAAGIIRQNFIELLQSQNVVNDGLFTFADMVEKAGDNFVDSGEKVKELLKDFLNQNNMAVTMDMLKLIEAKIDPSIEGDNKLVDNMFAISDNLQYSVKDIIAALQAEQDPQTDTTQEQKNILNNIKDDNQKLTEKFKSFIIQSTEQRLKDPGTIDQVISGVQKIKDKLSTTMETLYTQFDLNFLQPALANYEKMKNMTADIFKEMTDLYDSALADITSKIEEQTNKISELFIGPEGIVTEFSNAIENIKTDIEDVGLAIENWWDDVIKFFNTPTNELFGSRLDQSTDDMMKEGRSMNVTETGPMQAAQTELTVDAEPVQQAIDSISKLPPFQVSMNFDDGGLRETIEKLNENIQELRLAQVEQNNDTPINLQPAAQTTVAKLDPQLIEKLDQLINTNKTIASQDASYYRRDRVRSGQTI